jgi:hypothetical protein
MFAKGGFAMTASSKWHVRKASAVLTFVMLFNGGCVPFVTRYNTVVPEGKLQLTDTATQGPVRRALVLTLQRKYAGAVRVGEESEYIISICDAAVIRSGERCVVARSRGAGIAVLWPEMGIGGGASTVAHVCFAPGYRPAYRPVRNTLDDLDDHGRVDWQFVPASEGEAEQGLETLESIVETGAIRGQHIAQWDAPVPSEFSGWSEEYRHVWESDPRMSPKGLVGRHVAVDLDKHECNLIWQFLLDAHEELAGEVARTEGPGAEP